MQRAWDSDREQAEKGMQQLRAKLAKAVNAGQIIRSAIVGGAGTVLVLGKPIDESM